VLSEYEQCNLKIRALLNPPSIRKMAVFLITALRMKVKLSKHRNHLLIRKSIDCVFRKVVGCAPEVET
jgi:hypothetical protein